MFSKGNSAGGKIVAVADVGSGSAGVAILEMGTSPRLLALARENLSLEERSKEALRSGVMQSLVTAGDKTLAEFTAAGGSANRINSCYCVVGAPWTRSFPRTLHSQLEGETTITDSMIGSLAKQALTEPSAEGPANVFEANVVRILLNGYPTGDPAGKRAESIDLFTLASECDADIKSAAAETLAKLFPTAKVIWRSSARAVLGIAKEMEHTDSCLIVDIGAEATDMLSVRKGVIEERVFIEQGVRQILSTLAKGKPVEETLALMGMLEKDQSESDACEALRGSIAKVEPDLAHLFGEALAKISASRKLPDDLILIAPYALQPWLSRFFTRIDFTQFTATTRPFSVSAFDLSDIAGVPHNNPELFADTGLCIASGLINIELTS